MSLTKKEKKALNKGRENIRSGESLRTEGWVPPKSLEEALQKRACNFLVKYKQKHKLTSKQLSETLEITESQMSKILAYHIKDFSLTLVIRCLDKIRENDKSEDFDFLKIG